MRQKIAFLLFSYPKRSSDRTRRVSEETYWHDILLDRIANFIKSKMPRLKISVARPSVKLEMVKDDVGGMTYFYLPGVPSRSLSVMLFNTVSLFHLMTLKPSLVYSFTYGHTFPFLGALLYAKLARVPFFVDFRNPPASLVTDPFPQPNYLERLFLRVADRIVLRLSDRLVFINQKCRNLVQYSPALFEKSLVTANFAEDIWFQNKAQVRSHPGKTNFACWGTLDRTRSLEAVVRGFAKALSGCDEVHPTLYFVGNGNAETRLKNLVKELGVSKDIVFPGYLSQRNLIKFLKGIDVAVVPIPPHIFYQYSSPVKLAEAIVFELPVLASNIEPNTIVEEHGIGIVCDHCERDYEDAFLRFVRCHDLRPFSRNCRRVKYSFHPRSAFVELDDAVRDTLGVVE